MLHNSAAAANPGENSYSFAQWWLFVVADETDDHFSEPRDPVQLAQFQMTALLVAVAAIIVNH